MPSEEPRQPPPLVSLPPRRPRGVPGGRAHVVQAADAVAPNFWLLRRRGAGSARRHSVGPEGSPQEGPTGESYRGGSRGSASGSFAALVRSAYAGRQPVLERFHGGRRPQAAAGLGDRGERTGAVRRCPRAATVQIHPGLKFARVLRQMRAETARQGLASLRLSSPYPATRVGLGAPRPAMTYPSTGSPVSRPSPRASKGGRPAGMSPDGVAPRLRCAAQTDLAFRASG